ncbi:response regulator [Ketobacter sp.]
MEKVLVVDDDRLVRNVVSRYLSEQFIVETADSGESGIETASTFDPDFILLDIEMPGINGFEVCDRLKQNPDTKDIPVLIISGRTQLQERMQGYEAGAADFILKPFNPEELLAKLNVLSRFNETTHSLSERAAKASQTALTAMRGSSELGLAIQFIEATYNSKSYDSIAEKFFDVTNQLSLNCSLMFLAHNQRLFFSSGGATSPLEKEVIATIYDSGRRFCDFGSRTQINYPLVALLVKNMPLNDMESYGRYKDFLPTMLGSTDANVRSLTTEQALIDQSAHLTQSFYNVKDTLQSFLTGLRANQANALEVLRGTFSEFDQRIPKLGLEEDQEQYLLNTLDDAVQRSHGLVENEQAARTAFDKISETLDSLIEQQQSLIEEVTKGNSTDASCYHGGASAESNITGDVELF